MKEIEQYYFEQKGYPETFPKEHARILFNVKHGNIEDLIVEEFSSPELKEYLYKQYSFDFGNCLSDWEDWTFCDVLIKIFVCYNAPYKVRKKILFELLKVKEWRPYLDLWIWII